VVDKELTNHQLFFFGENMKVVVLISGKMRSGKNTFADMLIDEMSKYTDKKVTFDYFAKPVKDQCKDVFRNLTNYLNDVSKDVGAKCLYTDDDNWYEDKNDITRILLQTYATDIFRDKVDEFYWAKTMKEKLEKSEQDVILITDWRFKNEALIIEDSKEYKTLKIRIDRPELFIPYSEITQHQSEVDLDDYEDFDISVLNTSFESLRNSTLQLMQVISLYGTV
jgi:hypothetical protein